LISCTVSFLTRWPLESWRMIFRINLAMLSGRIWDSQARRFWSRAQSVDFAIFEVPIERE
jgi:hypothetical protein